MELYDFQSNNVQEYPIRTKYHSRTLLSGHVIRWNNFKNSNIRSCFFRNNGPICADYFSLSLSSNHLKSKTSKQNDNLVEFTITKLETHMNLETFLSTWKHHLQFGNIKINLGKLVDFPKGGFQVQEYISKG